MEYKQLEIGTKVEITSGTIEVVKITKDFVTFEINVEGMESRKIRRKPFRDFRELDIFNQDRTMSVIMNHKYGLKLYAIDFK